MRKIQDLPLNKVILNLLSGFLLSSTILLTNIESHAQQGVASWYSVESCRREGTSGIMANGEVLNDFNLTCASWDYPLGTMVAVRCVSTGKEVFVKVTDRGPSKKLYKKGRIIDLSKEAFGRIANLKQGLITVKVNKIKKGVL